jgi:sphinganine C4-monooxygenase
MKPAVMSFSNSSIPLFDQQLPPLPSYVLTPRPSLINGVPDYYLKLFVPTITYWVVAAFFTVIDELNLFPQHKMHTPEEHLKKNRAGFWNVIWTVIRQQGMQAGLGLFALRYGKMQPEYIGKEDFDIATWAQKIRLAQRFIPLILASVGLDPSGIARNVERTSPTIAGALLGGQYPSLTKTLVTGSESVTIPTFASWELQLAKAMYYCLVPIFQYFIAMLVFDACQYFAHRLFHTNKWLYGEFRIRYYHFEPLLTDYLVHVHSVHHKLNVPYAFGALYNHPLEGFVLDVFSLVLASKISGLDTIQQTIFFSLSNVKIVDDHCGYAFPWDPLQLITGNNNAYHDIHHQDWGIKSNFSQPWLMYWDRLLGTEYTGETEKRYIRGKESAKRAVLTAAAKSDKTATGGFKATKPTKTQELQIIREEANAPLGGTA